MVAITTTPSRNRPTTPTASRRRLAVVPAQERHGVSWAVTAALLAVVAVAALAFLVRSAPLDASAAPRTAGTHAVAEGETLWSIAGEVAPAGEAATYVERLVEVNGSTVAPGQVLTLPVP